MNLKSCLISAVSAAVIMITITGCAPPELPYLMPVAEFSFTGLWDEMLEMTGANGTVIHLQSFDVKTRQDKIERCSATFSSRDKDNTVMSFGVGTDMEGKLQWSGGELQGELPERPDYDPAETFAELDRIGIDAIVDNAKSSDIRIDYIYNERQCDYADMFRLEDGRLLPLREVSFQKDACAATIQVLRFYSRDADAPFTMGMFRSMGEWWFTGEDLDKAESAVYADHQQGPEFVSLLRGIYDALPDGWKMSLSTREGYMTSPQGLEEPVFNLFFKNTVDTFSIKEDPARTPISPSLRLFFYDIRDRESVLNVIEDEKENTWAVIPEYFDGCSDYVIVTSPAYINEGWRNEEAVQSYETLEEALKGFFAEERQ